MTWSISISAPSKDAAKRAVTVELPKAMLHQLPHARDFDTVRSAINGAIDACAEGAITVAGSGHLIGDWKDGDIPDVRGVSIQISISSKAAA
jgi:hypothetical protein